MALDGDEVVGSFGAETANLTAGIVVRLSELATVPGCHCADVLSNTASHVTVPMSSAVGTNNALRAPLSPVANGGTLTCTA